MRVTLLLFGAFLACDRGEAPDFAHPEEEARGAIRQIYCARSKGRMACRGETTHGVFGNGKMEMSSPTYVPVPGLRDVRSIAVSSVEAQVCAVAGRHAYCWGEPWSDGSVGANGGANVASATPRRVAGITGAIEVCAGMSHACARTSEGDVICWGDNLDGAIVDPASNPERYLAPTRAPRPEASRRYVDLVCGPSQTCAISETRDLYCWGGAIERDGRSQAAFGPTLVGTKIERVEIDQRLDVCSLTSEGVRTCWSDTTREATDAYQARRQPRY